MIASLIGYILTGLTAASIFFCVLSIHVARKFFAGGPPYESHPHSPATVLIPLCGADYRAYENYASFCRLDYPEYQIVFGVQDPRDSSLPVVRRIMEDFPQRDISLVISPKTIGENPKVNNLNNMLAKAKYDWLVLVDSDMRAREDYLKRVVPTRDDPATGLNTCLYRAGSAPNIPAKLEAIGIATEFAPGVLMAEFIEGISFAFGATIVIRREKLQALGGFQTIAPYLADDYMLGYRLWKMGYKINLLPYVVETMLPATSFKGMLKHQIRWARGIRACRPLGYRTCIITHTLPLALLNVLCNGGNWLSVLLAGVAGIARFSAAWSVGVKFLGDATTRRNFFLLPLRDLLAFGVWCMSVWGREVEWRGRRFRIVEDGKIKPV